MESGKIKELVLCILSNNPQTAVMKIIGTALVVTSDNGDNDYMMMTIYDYDDDDDDDDGNDEGDEGDENDGDDGDAAAAAAAGAGGGGGVVVVVV